MKQLLKSEWLNLWLFVIVLAFFAAACDAGAATQKPTKKSMGQSEIYTVLHKRLKDESPVTVYLLSVEIAKLCDTHQFDPALVLSLIHKESSFRKSVISHAGAVGLMQLLPTTAQYISDRNGITYNGPQDLHNPIVNVRLGIAYMAYLRSKFRDTSLVLAAYNLGPTNLNRQLRARTFHIDQMKNYVYGIKRGVASIRSEGAPRIELQFRVLASN